MDATQRKLSSKPKTIRYAYRDADKVERYRKVRKEWTENGERKKTCLFEHKNGQGAYVTGRGGESILYNLDVLVETPLDEFVFVVEGENKVEALRDWGFVATCNDGGAGPGKFKNEWADYFRGRTVVILPDNDKPGLAHAEAILATLMTVAELVSVCFLDGLAPKEDIVDWKEGDGNTREKFLELVNKCLKTARLFKVECEEQHASPEASAVLTQPAEGGPVTLSMAENAPFPEEPSAAAFHGLAGDLVRAIDPNTEAAKVAVLIQTLVCFGNCIGPGPHFRVENTRHALNLFAVVVGQTAKGRKGTSWNRVKEVFAAVDPEWTKDRIVSGMSSGEGLIWEVRDPVVKVEAVRERGVPTTFESVQVDQGVQDKRLLVLESEFASVLKQADRSGNILSAVLRQAWENGEIRTLSKNSPAKATGAHISIAAHITSEELRRYLSSTEAANGFGNRLIWCAVRRSKLLPDGGNPVDLSPLFKRFEQAVSFARNVGQMPRDDEARELWHQAYRQLSRERPGLVGALLGRSEAQTMRLACIYALLDNCFQVEKVHLQAALALWEYVERSTAFIFGQSTGDSVADDILSALRKSTDGLSRTDIMFLFSKHQTKERVQSALQVLETTQMAKCELVGTGGRSKEIWTYSNAKKAK
jgi:hypothetical protein